MSGDMPNLGGINRLVNEDAQFKRTMMSNFQKNLQAYDARLVNAYTDATSAKRSNQPSTINLSNMRYNYPAFMLFLDKKQIDMEMQYIHNRSLSNIFMAQLRAIMDGMFMHLLQATQSTTTSMVSFQVYTVQWLSNFTIHNHKVVRLNTDSYQNVETHITTFYIDLLLPKLDKVWEVVQFRNYLSDAYSLEELYFYLHARFLLRRGPTLHQFDSVYMITHYIQYDHAHNLVTRFLKTDAPNQ